VTKRSAPKWTINKMGNTKKGHRKTGCAKVIVPKRRAFTKNGALFAAVQLKCQTQLPMLKRKQTRQEKEKRIIT